MATLEFDKMTAQQKAAVALVAFGAEVSALVLKGLSEGELEKITVEIANLRDVPPEIEDPYCIRIGISVMLNTTEAERQI